MKIAPGTALRVALRFGPDHVVPVGRLAVDRGIAVLEYSTEFVATGLAINPVFDRAGPGLVWPDDRRAFGGLHGVFADSLPDAWGELLVRRRAAGDGIDYLSLTVLDKLAIVGRRGMGALVYEPAGEHARDDAVDIDSLARAAGAVLEGADVDVIPELERLGGSSGGARPKVLVAMDEAGTVRAGDDKIPDGFDGWIVKFRSSHDVADIGPLEATYAAVARAAGVAISETKLIAARNGPGYFAAKRFDRAPGGVRRHVLSVSGLLDSDWRVPALDYAGLLDTVRIVTRHQREVEQMFRRMVFNVVARNRDDHIKQHAFITDESGRWSLAPAYDLTFSAGPGGEHYLAVGKFGKDVPPAAIEAVAVAQAIGTATVRTVIGEVTDAVSRFSSFARDFGVSRRTTAEVRKALDAQLATYAVRA